MRWWEPASTKRTPKDLEKSLVFNLAAFVEAHLALGDDSDDDNDDDLGLFEDGCMKDLDTKTDWEDWCFP